MITLIQAVGTAVRYAVAQYQAAHPVNAFSLESITTHSYELLPPAARLVVSRDVWAAIVTPILEQVAQGLPIPPSPYLAVPSQAADGVAFDTKPAP